MIRVIQELKIEVSKPNFIQAIVAKQYDNNSRFLKVTLVNGNEEITVMPTSTVTINAKRKDGESKAFAGEVNDDGTVTVPLTYWMLELDGTVNCDISVVDIEGRKLTTTTFVMSVERASFNGDEISDDENYDILVKLIEDVNKVKPDLEFDPESENAQSGIAVAQALSGASGVKYIREYTDVHTLEDGTYIIDGENGGEVWFGCDEANEYGFDYLTSGFLFVSYDFGLSLKKISCFSTNTTDYFPILFTVYLNEDGSSADDLTTIYVSKKYVDEQIATLREEIGGIENGSY